MLGLPSRRASLRSDRHDAGAVASAREKIGPGDSSLTRLSSVLIGIVVVRRPAGRCGCHNRWHAPTAIGPEVISGERAGTFGCRKHGRSGGANGRDATWTTSVRTRSSMTRWAVAPRRSTGSSRTRRTRPTYAWLQPGDPTWDRPPRHSGRCQTRPAGAIGTRLAGSTERRDTRPGV